LKSKAKKEEIVVLFVFCLKTIVSLTKNAKTSGDSVYIHHQQKKLIQ